MLFAVIAIAVAAAFLLRREPPNEHEADHGGGSGPHDEMGPQASDHAPQGGGIDLKAVGTVAGSALTLGGTIVGALGGGGGAAAAGGGAAAAGGGGGIASGGTAAAGTAGAAGTTAGAAGTTAGAFDLATAIAGQAAFVGYSGVTTGAAALGVTALWFAPFIIGAALAQVAEFAGAQREIWSELSSNKRRLYFGRWYRFEEMMVQRYLLKLAEVRNANVAYTKRPVQRIEDADIGGFVVYDSIVDKVQDAEAQQAIPAVRAIARWTTIAMNAQYNRAVANYWVAAGYTLEPATVQAGLLNQNGSNPGMLPSDYWRLVTDYLAFQPFARVTGSGAEAWSYQPYGHLAQTNLTALQAKMTELLGAAADTHAFETLLMGTCKGVTLATSQDYQIAWPGEGEYTRALGVRCGLLSEPGTQKVGPWVVQFVINAANQWRTVLRDTQKGFAFDVTQSRQLKAPVIYAGSTLQGVSWPWP